MKAVWFTLFAISVAVGIWYVASRLTDLMITIAICFFLAFAIEPAVNRLAARGWKRGRATLLVYVAVIAGASLFFALFGRLLFAQIIGLTSNAQALYVELADQVESSLGYTLPAPDFLIENYLDDVVRFAAAEVLGVLSSLLLVLFGTLTVLLVTFYLVADGPRFRRAVCSVFPARKQTEILAIWEVAIDKTSSYLVSRSILAAICGTATAIFLLIAQVPYALALGAFTGIVAQFVPTIGTYIAGAVPVLVAFGASPAKGIATLIFILAYQQVENLTIEPRISAKAMELNTAVSFLSVLAGAAVLGPIGALLALPFAATVKAFLSTYLQRNEVVESHLTRLDQENESADPVS